MTLQHKFVDSIPDEVPFGWIFICIRYKTAVHQCVCGCGNEVITPLSPTDWKLIFDGQTISLSPSIGNWNFECRSHYWIVRNEIKLSGNWTDKQVKESREKDAIRKKRFFSRRNGKKKP